MGRERGIEDDTRKKYNGGVYHADTICSDPNTRGNEYADDLLRIKFSLLRKHLSPEMPVLDLCCGSGLHLLSLAEGIKTGTGIDFSRTFIQKAQQAAGLKKNIRFLVGNVRQLPFRDQSFGLVYSFSALYHIPGVNEVISEISRIMLPTGKCIVELGNLYSLNTSVCRHYPELAHPCHIPLKHMYEMLDRADLVIREHRAFQILPLWGDRPKWLYPLLHPFWNRIMKIKINGKMIDELISNAPFIKRFAFRHIFVCTK